MILNRSHLSSGSLLSRLSVILIFPSLYQPAIAFWCKSVCQAHLVYSFCLLRCYFHHFFFWIIIVSRSFKWTGWGNVFISRLEKESQVSKPSYYYFPHVSLCMSSKCILLHNWETICSLTALIKAITHSFSIKVSGQFHFQLTNYPMVSFAMLEPMCF